MSQPGIEFTYADIIAQLPVERIYIHLLVYLHHHLVEHHKIPKEVTSSWVQEVVSLVLRAEREELLK